MLADALAKGSVDRERLCQALAGHLIVQHDFKQWRPLPRAEEREQDEGASGGEGKEETKEGRGKEESEQERERRTRTRKKKKNMQKADAR